ncbi:universal stress protein [Saccharopolyspora sp. NPDC003752]
MVGFHRAAQEVAFLGPCADTGRASHAIPALTGRPPHLAGGDRAHRPYQRGGRGWQRERGCGPSIARGREHAQLLVVGHRGLGGFPGLLVGSVTRGVLHHPPCPVAVVPD